MGSDTRVEHVDLAVIGTGAAGMTAAAVAAEEGAGVAVFEKADLVGGTTAWSGGQVWIPNNPHMARRRHRRRSGSGDHLHHVAVAGHARPRSGRGVRRRRAGDGGVPRGSHAGAVLRGRRHARLSPRVPGRQARGWPDDRVSDLSVRRPGRVGRQGDALAILLQRPHHDE